MSKSLVLVFIGLFGIGYLSGCTAGGAGDSPCQRTCGNRPVGGGNLKGVPYTASMKFECSSGTTLAQQKLYFLIYEDTKGEEDPEDTSAKVPERLPKAGIAFTPMVPASVTLDSSSSDWCTDSCGIAEIKFTPICGQISDSFIAPLVPGMTGDDLPKTTFNMDLPQ
ncbi:MAG: hypothetical protein WCL28_11020 [bacterium]